MCLRSMHAPAQRKYPHQHRTHTPGKKKNALTTQEKCTPQQQYARTWCVCARVRVSLRLNLLLKPAPVSGSVCGGGGVCLCLALLFRLVGALCIVCGVCVCECEWSFIYWVRVSR